MLTAGSRGSEGRGQGEAPRPPTAEGLEAWPGGAHRQPGCLVRPPLAPPQDAAAPPGQAQVHSLWLRRPSLGAPGRGLLAGGGSATRPLPLAPPHPKALSARRANPCVCRPTAPPLALAKRKSGRGGAVGLLSTYGRSWATPVLGPGLCCRYRAPGTHRSDKGLRVPQIHVSITVYRNTSSAGPSQPQGRQEGQPPIHPHRTHGCPGPAGVGQAAAPPPLLPTAWGVGGAAPRVRCGQDQGHRSGGGRVPIVIVLGLAEGQRQGQAGLPLQPLFFLAGPRRPGLEEV